MTFYGTPATGAGWIVPKKYVEKVGDDGFKKAPDRRRALPLRLLHAGHGAGARGQRVLLAQNAQREAPGVQGDAGRGTRLAMLKRGEVDIVYSIRGALAEELARTPGLTLKPHHLRHVLAGLHRAVETRSRHGLISACGWPQTSPSTGKAINQAETLGSPSSPAASSRRTSVLLAAPALPLRSHAREAAPGRGGIPRTASTRATTTATPPMPTSARRWSTTSRRWGSGQAAPAGARRLLRQNRDKKLKNIIQMGSGAPATPRRVSRPSSPPAAPTPTEATPTSTGSSSEQAGEIDPNAEAMLHKIQQLMHEKTMFAPIWSWPSQRLRATGGRIRPGPHPGHPYSAPYEDMKLK